MRRSQGFTLVEILLALSLAALLLGITASAVHLYGRMSESSVREVQRAELARSVLHKIATDLRGAVRPPLDVSPGNTTTLQTSQGQGRGGESSEGEASESSSGSESQQSESLVSSTDTRLPPGIYGDAFQLQVDTCRVPQLDQVTAWSQSGDQLPPTLLSDVRTVSYFLRDGVSPNGGGNQHLGTSGLARRTLARASAVWDSANGNALQNSQLGHLLAAEVRTIEFRYFNGVSWYSSWDTQLQQGLPIAVEVAILVASPDATADPYPSATASILDGDTDEASGIYRMLVPIPAATQSTGSATSTPPSDDDAS